MSVEFENWLNSVRRYLGIPDYWKCQVLSSNNPAEPNDVKYDIEVDTSRSNYLVSVTPNNEMMTDAAHSCINVAIVRALTIIWQVESGVAYSTSDSLREILYRCNFVLSWYHYRRDPITNVVSSLLYNPWADPLSANISPDNKSGVVFEKAIGQIGPGRSGVEQANGQSTLSEPVVLNVLGRRKLSL